MLRRHMFDLVVALAFAAMVVPGGTRAWSAPPPDAPSAYRTVLPPEGAAALVPLGDMAGSVAPRLPDNLPNPFEGQPAAVTEGRRLFTKMNCAGCHNYDGSGGQGPNLTDHYWRYGGTPVDVFKTLWEGRPQGMPAWSGALTPDELWKIVAFVQSLGGMYPAADYYGQRQGDNPRDLIAPEIAAEDAALRTDAASATGKPPEPAPKQ